MSLDMHETEEITERNYDIERKHTCALLFHYLFFIDPFAHVSNALFYSVRSRERFKFSRAIHDVHKEGSGVIGLKRV